MKRQRQLIIAGVILIISFFTCVNLFAWDSSNTERIITPLVSTDWLADNIGLANLVIIDVRTAAEYAAGHIAGSINVPFETPVCAWIVIRDNLILEIPDDTSLFSLIGSCGISKNSQIVIVTKIDTPPAPPYSTAGGNRVADTLIYAGLKNVSILDGGFNKWVATGNSVTTVVPTVTPVTYQGEIQREMIVSLDYVKSHLNRVILLDTRNADVYFGVTIEPFAQKAGHIPTARSLPSPWMWNEDGTYKANDVLGEMALGVMTQNFFTPWNWCQTDEINYGVTDLWKSKEIVVYCGVGGYASSWWFVLTQVLGYKNVKMYDGSAQEWVRANDMVKYNWTH